MTTIHLDPNMVPAALRQGYTGKKYSAEVCTAMTVPSDAGLWSEGSRDKYSIVEIESGRVREPFGQNSAPWDRSRRDFQLEVKPGYLVVRHTIYRGADLGLHFYVHPDNAAKLLPAPAEALPRVEKLVLLASKSFKSSYMGKDRYDMMREDYRYGRTVQGDDSFPTREQWNVAKLALMAKGLLNKAGAITVAGRNAVQS